MKLKVAIAETSDKKYWQIYGSSVEQDLELIDNIKSSIQWMGDDIATKIVELELPSDNLGDKTYSVSHKKSHYDKLKQLLPDYLCSNTGNKCVISKLKYKIFRKKVAEFFYENDPFATMTVYTTSKEVAEELSKKLTDSYNITLDIDFPQPKALITSVHPECWS